MRNLTDSARQAGRAAARKRLEAAMAEQAASRRELKTGIWIYKDTPPGIGWVLHQESPERKLYYATEHGAMAAWNGYLGQRL